jgi:hypothetical protein
VVNLVADAPASPSDAPVSRPDDGPDYNFGPDFAWAAVGGLALLALSVVVLSLAMSWGGFNPGATTPGGPVAPISAYYPELAGLFLTGFLITLIARSLNTRTGTGSQPT